MKKQKLRNIIALSLFCFYVFYAVISLTYKPPKHNYSKEDLRKIKEQQEKKQKSQPKIGNKQQTSTNHQQDDQSIKPHDIKSEQDLVTIKGLDEFNDLEVWDELDQPVQEKVKTEIKTNNLWMCFFWIEHDTEGLSQSQIQEHELESNKINETDIKELIFNVVYESETEESTTTLGNTLQQITFIEAKPELNYCFTYQFFYYEYEGFQALSNSSDNVGTNLIFNENLKNASQNNLWKLYFWQDYNDIVLQSTDYEPNQFNNSEQDFNHKTQNILWKRYFQKDVYGDNFDLIESQLIGNLTNTILEQVDELIEIVSQRNQHVIDDLSIIPTDNKWKRYFVFELEGDEYFTTDRDIIQDSISDDQTSQNSQNQELDSINKDYSIQTTNDEVIQDQSMDEEQLSEAEQMINEQQIKSNISAQVPQINTTEYSQIDQITLSNPHKEINTILAIIGFLLFNLLAFNILNEKVDKQVLVKNKEIQTDHDSLVELNYLFQEFLIHQRLFNEKILVSQGMIEQCVKQII